jgi:hypothetical protein
MSLTGYDKKHPYSYGHRLARPYFTWVGYVVIVLSLPLLVVASLYMIDVITTAPLTLPIMTAVLFFFYLVLFGFGIVYRGKKFRDTLAKEQDSGDTDENMVRDQMLRADNDQWLLTIILPMWLWILIMYTIFLSRNLSTFAPIPDPPTAADTTGYVISKMFQGAIALSVMIQWIVLMYTGSDFAYRQAYASSAHHMDEHGHQMPADESSNATRHRSRRGKNEVMDLEKD